MQPGGLSFPLILNLLKDGRKGLTGYPGVNNQQEPALA